MERFKNLPKPLRKLVAERLVLGVVTLALGALCHICLRSWLLSLPGFVVGFFLIFSGFRLFLRLASGDYLCLRGVCRETEKAGLGRQARHIVIDVEGKPVRLTVGKKQRHLTVGDAVILYLLPDTPVYEQDGVSRVYSWLALERLPFAEKD